MVFALLPWWTGCATRLETASGSTWIVGFSRGAPQVRDFGEDSIIVHDESQSAPLELGLVPYGFSLGLADARQAEERILDAREREQFVPRRDFGIALGSGPRPWRFGVAYYRAPQRHARVRARVDTVRGLALRLAHKDSRLMAGVSRTCVTELNQGDHDVLICCGVNRRFPEITITKPQEGD